MPLSQRLAPHVLPFKPSDRIHAFGRDTRCFKSREVQTEALRAMWTSIVGWIAKNPTPALFSNGDHDLTPGSRRRGCRRRHVGGFTTRTVLRPFVKRRSENAPNTISSPYRFELPVLYMFGRRYPRFQDRGLVQPFRLSALDEHHLKSRLGEHGESVRAPRSSS